MKRPLLILFALLWLVSGAQAYPTPQSAIEKIKAKDLDFTMKAFMHAVSFHRHDDIRWFVAAGMNIDKASDGNGYYAIHNAANNRRADTALLLLTLGADPNKQSKNQLTPLHYAVRNNATGLITALVKKGANVSAATDKGRTPLHLAAAQGQLDTLRILLKVGANVEARDHEGRTPLLVAVRRGRHEMIEPLIKAGANVNVTSSQGRAKNFTPLVQAIRLHDRNLISTLIEAGADVNATTHSGFTPVMVTLLENDALSLVQLIAHGAQVNDKGGRKETPLRMCKYRSERRLCDLLIKAGATLPPETESQQSLLLSAVRSQRHSEVQRLLKNGVSPNFGDHLNKRPINAAAINADVEMVDLLIQHGAEVNWIDPRTGQNLAFVFARERMVSASVLDVVLKAGLNINLTDLTGEMPLAVAAGNANSDILKVMLNAGAKVNSVNKFGWSALMIAARAGRIKNVSVLLNAGADRHLKLVKQLDDKQGRTAYEIAKQSGQSHCAELIQKAAVRKR